jgi:hypothetical protein
LPFRTAVAHFENGTVVNLVKVRASPEYMALMERLVPKPTTPYWLSRFGRVGYSLSLWRGLRRILGLPSTGTVAVLAQLVAALKAESEAVLQDRIGAVAVTAPWVPAWEDAIPVDSAVNDALVFAGLEPWTWEASGPIYLSETSAVLAANGRRLCKERWCGLDEGQLSDMWSPTVYFIRFTPLLLTVSDLSAV